MAAWSPAATDRTGAEMSGGWPESRSNPQDSQKRPDLAVPHSGQGSAGSAGCDDDDGDAASAPAGLADALIRTPQMSQKSLLAES